MKKKNRLLRLSFLIAFLAFFGLGQNAWAATVTAIGTGNWNAGGTWSTGAVPQAGDDVVIPTGYTVTVNTAVDGTTNPIPNTITLNGTAVLTISAELRVATGAAGGITLNGTSTLTMGAAALTIGSDVYRGDITMNDNSTFTTTTQNFTLSGTWTKGVDATITSSTAANYIFVGTTPLSLPSTIVTANSLVVNKVGGTVTLNGAMTIAAAGNFTITNGTLIVGDNNLTVTGGGAGVSSIATGATLNANYTDANKTRTFAQAFAINGTLNSSGPRNSTVTNNTFSTAAVTLGATGVLNIANSTTLISFEPTLTSGGTINAEGAKVTYSGGAVSFLGIALQTNSNTDLVLSASAAISNFPAITNLHSLEVTTVNGPTLTGSLTVAEDVKIDLAGGLTVGANTLTVNGTFTNTTAAGVVATSSTLILNGPAVFTANITSDATTNITFGGSGAITTFPFAAAAFNNVTYNRTGVNTTLTAHVLTIGGDLTITAGTITAAVDLQFVVTGTTTIGANGTLDMATFINTFAGPVTGTGTMDISAVGTTGIVFSGAYSFTGNLITSNLTFLSFTTHASDVNLNSSVTELNTLTWNRGAQTLTLNNDLTITAAATALTLVAGTLDVNGNTLTFSGAYIDAGAAWTLSAENSSLVFVGVATFDAAATYNIDETTNLEFQATPVGIVNLSESKNFTMSAAVTFAADFEIHGNLTITGASTLTTGAFNTTVRGDISLDATGTIVATGATLTVHGAIQGEGTYTTTDATTLVVAGTSSQLVLPYTFGATALGQLTLNRPSGMKLNRNITIGSATLGLTITNGDLDLNGYVITLGNVATVMSETAGNTVINTGASGTANGYITTATVDEGEAAASGIGVVAIAPAANYVVRRFPVTVPVPGVGLSTSRIYQISTNAPTSVTLQYDNTELNSSASDLRLYTSASLAFAVYDDRTDDAGTFRTVNANTPAGKGNVAYSSFNTVGENVVLAADHFFALAAEPGDGGVMRIAMNNGNWGSAATWSPAGIPSKVDQAVIGPATVTLNGNGVTYEAKTLHLNHANATLQPFNNNINGDVVNLRVMGNITVAAGAEILGVNGQGRINLIIGDGITTGVSSNITVNNDYVPTSGIWVHNLTVNTADVELPSTSGRMRISGDIELIANSAVELDNIEFWGGYDANQTISIPTSANLKFASITLDNNASVSTTSDFELENQILVKNNTTFNATGGTVFFTEGDAGRPWNVENGGTLRLNNVEFNSTGNADFEPLGTAYIQGNFWQYNTDAFAPTSGRVIFSNNALREIVNTSTTAADLTFYEIEIAPGTQVVTSNSWNVAKEIDVKAGGSLIADNGTIEMVGTAPLYIKNASTQTLEFNNLTITNNTFTSDSWTIKGNLTTAAALTADKGTITFQNIQEKEINATGVITFFNIKIADGSKVTTATGHNFTIANNATNPTGAGIEVEGTGEFYVDETSVITFNAGVGVAAGNPKMITKSSAGKLEFGLITIAASANNEVATASSFTLTGAGDAFNNEGAGAKFTATAGEITFTDAAPVIVSVSPGVSQFYSVKTQGTTALTFPNAAQEIYVAGDVTINGQSSIAPANADNKTIFNGSTLQTIGGNSTALTPISLADVVINKANDSELLLDINTVLGTLAAHELTLVDGILNLGSKTLTSGAGIVSRIDGVINGGTGTFIIATNFASASAATKLEDAYFTIGGIPTLYNLTVNAAHITANTLTVNGTLNLNTANLTIGTGASASSPIMLVLNGDLTRTTGLLGGGDELSRLVLQGSGSVVGGLSNAYFNGGVTTAQLEIARAEVLGGNLNIADGVDLRINTGINDFDLGTNTLTIGVNAGNPTSLVMISGGIKSGLNSTVVLEDDFPTIPASMFRNNEVYNLTIAAAITLAGDLQINGTLTIPNTNFIRTGENVLTFAQNATIPVFTNASHVIGNLRRYVTNTATVFNVGNGNAGTYVPVTLQFANVGSVQPVLVKRSYIDPTLNKGGNATNSVDVLWTITPEGVAVNDSIKAIFSWHSSIDGGTAPSINASFPAKWNGTYWTDYRNKLNNFTLTDPRVLTMSGFALTPATLAGEWAVFNATANTDAAKDAAIAVTNNRIVFTDITPNPVVVNNAFKATVQLQDAAGQPIVAAESFEFAITKAVGAAALSGTTVIGVIPAGQSMVTLSGLSFTLAGGNTQLQVDTTGSSANWTSTVSEYIDVLDNVPASQATNIQFSNVGATSMTIGWTDSEASRAIVLIKPDTLLLPNEFPIDGTTYYANTIVGAGSNIGNATLVFNGVTTANNENRVNVTGLAPNTTYFVYVFKYSGTFGMNENYRTTAASGNPRSQATVGSYDDDVTYGPNNTRATSKTIGTNTPIKATMRDASDEDWFNFTVTNVSPNVRAQIYNLPGNYTLEVYDMDGRRIRRSTLGGTSSEAAVINNLPSGTYTVRIFSQDGSYWTRPGEEYMLKVSTFGNEIYAVTP